MVKKRGMLVLFLVVAAILVLTGCQWLGPSAAAGAEVDQEEATAVVKSFYEWYVAYEGNPFGDRVYRDSPLVTAEFVADMDARIDAMIAAGPGGADLVLCAQDYPGAMRYGQAEVSGKNATAIIEQVWNPDTAFESVRQLTVRLEKVEGEWLIAEIGCPAQ